MKMKDALTALCELIKDGDLLVSANGSISRELYAAKHRDANFYMLGSMGQASSIALGIALARPERRVIVLDGDGNLLMNLGILATVRACRSHNFMHVVLDNGVYNTTGAQPSAAAVVDLARVAKAAGYRSVVVARTAAQVRRSARRMLAGRGPRMLLAKVEPGPNPELVRIPLTPEQIKKRFRKAAGEKGSPKRPRPKRRRRRVL